MGEQKKRIALTMTQADYDRLVIFAKVTGKLPAVAARNILIEYLDIHAKDIDAVKQAADNYHSALQHLNTGYISLFEDSE